MRRSEDQITRNIDWLMVGLYMVLVCLGWFTIFSAEYDPESELPFWEHLMKTEPGKQLIWIGSSLIIVLAIIILDYKFYHTFSYLLYGFIIVVLLVTLGIAHEVKGSRSWIGTDTLRIQPAEFARFFTALALANFLGGINVKFKDRRTQLISFGILALPILIILLQNETGVAITFGAFLLVLYREGLTKWVLIIGFSSFTLFLLSLMFDPRSLTLFFLSLAGATLIGYAIFFRIRTVKQFFINTLIVFAVTVFCIGTSFLINHLVYGEAKNTKGLWAKIQLKDHHKERFKTWIHPEQFKSGKGYQLNQSKTAIGSGGFSGKGYLNGTQAKLDYLPAPTTDFVFAHMAEEQGWWKMSFIIIPLYVFFMLRLVNMAERQKDKFVRIYGYSIASIIFFHFVVNVGMNLGLFPIIGIPLPFISYGGSAMWSFTLMLFVFIKLDAHRNQLLSHG